MFNLLSKATSALGSFLPSGTSSEHVANAGTHLKNASSDLAEATKYSAGAVYNTYQVAMRAAGGALGYFTVVKHAFEINTGLQAAQYAVPAAFAPVVGAMVEGAKIGLIFAIEHPLVALSAGVLAGVSTAPEHFVNLGKNVGNAAYKTGEAALEVAKAGGEVAIAGAIITGDAAHKGYEAAKTATEYAVDIAEYVAEHLSPVVSTAIDKISETKQSVAQTYYDKQKGFGEAGNFTSTIVESKFIDSFGFEEISLEDSANIALSGDWTLIDVAPAA